MDKKSNLRVLWPFKPGYHLFNNFEISRNLFILISLIYLFISSSGNLELFKFSVSLFAITKLTMAIWSDAHLAEIVEMAESFQLFLQSMVNALLLFTWLCRSLHYMQVLAIPDKGLLDDVDRKCCRRFWSQSGLKTYPMSLSFKGCTLFKSD